MKIGTLARRWEGDARRDAAADLVPDGGVAAPTQAAHGADDDAGRA